jgi:hypothetical protein
VRRVEAVCVVAALLASSSSVAAQSSVADGVTALSRGEYQRAYDILRPFAEGEPWGDAAAQFFLGSMFESGLGVPRDPLRACAYYHRAGTSESLFGMAAMRLHRAAFLKHGAEFSAECQRLGNLGFDHRFEPVTFDLGAGHSIGWSLRGATISYQGRTTFHEQHLAGRGAAYLPLRYTAIQTGGPSPRVRHFVEVFVWHPAPNRPWSLLWHLFEVAGSDLIRIADDQALATSPTKPEVPRDDVRERVVVRTNAEGNVEWAILEGPNARREPIESEEERREAREIEAAERAALDKVDWDRRFDAYKTPTLNYAPVGGGGCGNVYLYALTSDRGEAIVVHADRQALQLSSAARSFEIARHPTSITLTVTMYSQPVRRPACTDIIPIPAGREPQTWRAVSGRVTIELSRPGIRARNPELHRATIRIDDAEFIDSSGRRLRQTAPIVLSAVVGSSAG